MKTVEILMSTYNGSKTIERQIISILNQKDVKVHITIRDDGSKDTTCKEIERLIGVYRDSITLIKGVNFGWKKSFIELIKLARKADYYGFSDQDDYWLPEKLIMSIKLMENDKSDGVKLAHVNSLCTNNKLEIQDEQQKRYDKPRNRKAVIAQEYFQGCSMLWNNEAMILLQSYTPKSDVAHDFWVGTVCYYLGTIYYCDTPLFYHIRYDNNSSCDGNVRAGRKKRIDMIKNDGIVYMNPAADLISGYSDSLLKKDLRFLKEVVESKNNVIKRVKLILMPGFRRESIKSTCLFKIMILLGRY